MTKLLTSILLSLSLLFPSSALAESKVQVTCAQKEVRVQSEKGDVFCAMKKQSAIVITTSPLKERVYFKEENGKWVYYHTIIFRESYVEGLGLMYDGVLIEKDAPRVLVEVKLN